MFVNILLIAAVGLTFPWINKIFYITLRGLTGLLLPACSLCGLVLSTYNHIWVFVLAFGSLSPFSFCLFVCARLFSLSQHFLLVPMDVPGTLALNCSLFLFLSSSISHLLSGVSVSARQGVPGVTLRVMSS